MHTGHMTTTEIGFSLIGLRVIVHYDDPNGILESFTRTATVLDQFGDLIKVETDEDEFGETAITIAYTDDIDVIVPTVLVADETDPPSDRPLIDPDVIDGTYRLEF